MADKAVPLMAKMGYFFDQNACIGCKTCQIACKDKNDLEIGQFFRRVRDYESGRYPHARVFHHSMTCNHCEFPACVAACPNAAMYSDEEDGTVQHDDSKCIGCQYCVEACPYGIPLYMSDLGVVHKCDACIELRMSGEHPACVASCPMRALEFGNLKSMEESHAKAVRETSVLPSSSKTMPCTLIDAKSAALEGESVEVRL